MPHKDNKPSVLLCGCADRSAYVEADYICDKCGPVCKICAGSCRRMRRVRHVLKAASDGK